MTGDAIVDEAPGAVEVRLARRFFDALQRGDARALAQLLDDATVLRNLDGTVATANRHALAERLAAHGPDVEYRLDEIAASPGLARASRSSSATCRAGYRSRRT